MTSERPPNETLRLFVAVELPEAWLEALRTYQAAVKSRTPAGPGISWPRPEGFHMTLKFLGGVDATRLPEIESLLSATVPVSLNLELRLTNTYTFGGRPIPRVLAARYQAPGQGDRLEALVRKLDAAFVNLGIPRESRRFLPHITLARIRPEISREAYDTFVIACGATQPQAADFVARQVSLMRSHIGPGGARYERIAAFPPQP